MPRKTQPSHTRRPTPSPAATLDLVISSKPVDRTARLVTGPGERHDIKIPPHIPDQSGPPRLTVFPDKNEYNITGQKFGRLTVIGFSGDHGSTWVVRCSCGMYSLRRAKTLRRNGREQMCWTCSQNAVIRRRISERPAGDSRVKVAEDGRYDVCRVGALYELHAPDGKKYRHIIFSGAREAMLDELLRRSRMARMSGAIEAADSLSSLLTQMRAKADRQHG
jgi:hypothetical protein